MFTLKRLVVEGFRGFREAEEFEFDQPATELFGDNRSGKSSTLNAIEWGMFGDACAGKQTGIRERVGWLVPNQHLLEPAVRVELEIEGPQGNIVIVRTLSRPPKKSSEQESLELRLPDGNTLTGDVASEHLAGLLQSSFRDFLTTVYQHQEAIRAVLTQEPKDRNDAIDRLLGLSDRRNLLCALDAANLRGQQKQVGKDFDGFEEQITAALSARENDLVTLRQEALEAGLVRNQLNGKAAVAAANKAAEALEQFAEEAELDPPDVQVPDDWTGLAGFDKTTRKIVSQLRGEVPGIEEQKELLKRQQQLLAIKAALESIRQRRTELATNCRRLDKEHGGRKAIDAKIADVTEKLDAHQEELRRTNSKAAVVSEAIEYFDGLDVREAPCPVCESVVPRLADNLRDVWAAKLKAQVERITTKINALKAQLKELRGIAAQYQKLNEDLETLEEEQLTLRERTAKQLDVELADDDDPLALTVADLNTLESRLKKLGKVIQERQERLDTIDHDLGLVRLVRDYLHLEQKKQVVEAIQESKAFKQLEATRDQVAELVEDAEAIKGAVAEVAREEAEARLECAGKTIDEYFRRLSRNPGVQELKLVITADKRTHRNSYEITDQDGKDLAPILSQGDLNALALAIFLGLSASAKDGCAFGFLMLDDPSQSLGTDHKKHLAELINLVAQDKRVIVSTMDAEFHSYLTDVITKSKRQYQFGKWTPEEGPTITMEEVAGATGTRIFERLPKARLKTVRR